MLPDLSGIHYNDALLSAIFAISFFFAGYTLHRFTKIDKAISKLDKKMMKRINKANKKGAKDVQEKFEVVMDHLNRIGDKQT